MLLRTPHQPFVENDGVQPVEGLAHSYGPAVGGIKGAALFVDWGDEGLGDAGWQYTSAEAAVEEAGEERGPDPVDPDLVTAAIFHGTMIT